MKTLLIVAVIVANFATIVNAQTTVNAYLTGYSYWDNDPPGSTAIARPGVRPHTNGAGGTGTYDDPITIAVGRHSDRSWHYSPGTVMYIVSLQKYAIVEDICGACSRETPGTRVDIWAGGADVSRTVARQCLYSITGSTEVIIDPPNDLPVIAGEIVHSNCENNG